MFDKTTVFVLVSFLATLWLATISATQYSELIDKQQQHELDVKRALENNPLLVALGTVGSKTFFMDNSTRRTWDAAKTYATSMNMKLAEIGSVAEAQFIKGLSQTVLTSPFYWMGGRDSLLITQHIWDSSRTALNGYDQITWLDRGIYRTCVVLYVNTATNKYYYAHSCTETNFVLLQVP